jgi:drug/metabolite transporter (DMT)-like permease
VPDPLPPRLDRPLLGIAYRLASITSFTVMSAMIKACDDLPTGELVFFRSAMALLPIGIFLAMRGELRDGFRTGNVGAHLFRSAVGLSGMSCGFFALTRLPLPEATTINYASPLIAVVLGALVLHERVGAGRWLAVAVGLGGVVVIAWPRLTLFGSGAGLDFDQSVGAAAALAGALISAGAALLIRTLTRTERSSTIVLYYAVLASVLSFGTIVFGWAMPTPGQWALLIGAGILGGIGQILFTEAFRLTEVSTLAPLEYSSVVLAVAFGYFFFGDVPTLHMLLGGVLVVAAGLYIVFRAGR